MTFKGMKSQLRLKRFENYDCLVAFSGFDEGIQRPCVPAAIGSNRPPSAARSKQEKTRPPFERKAGGFKDERQ
jgi:hypothetical protein